MKTTTARALHARMSDAAALAALSAPGTHYAVSLAFASLTRDRRGDRDPVDVVRDAEHVLAAVRAWAKG